ncbi:rhomboid family intramembrane serine protease [Luteolibacter pohnpeiensis]|uniref:Rhomboid family intramembrane serine protease n=1 Tax=Luteolibacter pohnpeiensis TaxID=454153 RepID=A0A934VXJ8_9BACT|nr:rhomboid family intramembrane serine protease [Luteolibacter pohnpeiensis]MBK1883928.1 rhomboid family intramembrane serine protease [Luteolibacter pohnpeiensis]
MGTFFLNGAEKFREIRKSWAVAVVVIAMIGLHLFLESQGGAITESGEISPWVIRFGLSGEQVLHGKIWQLVTYAWFHGNLLHLGLNMMCLIMLGSRVEQMLGTRVFLVTLFAGILGGGIGHLPMSLAGDQAPVLIGMSGGCVGLLLLLTTLSPESRMWPLPVSGKALGMGLVIGELILTLVDRRLEIPGFEKIGTWFSVHGLDTLFQVGHSCHLGGALAGWIVGRWLLRPRVSLASLRRQRERREAKYGNGPQPTPEAGKSAP